MTQKNIEIKGITLLSKEEYKACRDIIPKKRGGWWLRSASRFSSSYAGMVYSDGHLGINYVCANYGVAPALICDLENLPRESKVEFADHRWTVISEDMIFCDDIIGHFPFNLKEKDGDDYENSSVKDYVEGWFESYKNAPITLIKESDQTRAKIDDLLCDINSAEIAGQIQMDNLTGWIKTWKFVMNQALDEAFAEEPEDGWEAVQYPIPLSDGSTTKYRCRSCNTTWDTATPYCPYCGKRKGDTHDASV